MPKKPVKKHVDPFVYCPGAPIGSAANHATHESDLGVPVNPP